jgi:patatin-like phospholipase/acyl hydrolase
MRILSIDGGGILGCGPARYLKLLEAETGRWEGALAGCSVGALLAALRAVGYTWAEIDRIFQEEGPRIFARPSLYWRLNPLAPKYPSTTLENACKKYLRGFTCNQSRIPLYIPAMDMATGRPKVFDDTDTDLLAEVVLRSTAAPTYFAPRDGRWVDGGLVANNPSGLAVLALLHRGIPVEEISVLSMDTGGKFWKDPKVSGRMLPTSWIQPVIRSQMHGNEEAGEFACDALLGARHTRITPSLPHDYELDAVGSIGAYTGIWEQCWQATKGDAVTAATR